MVQWAVMHNVGVGGQVQESMVTLEALAYENRGAQHTPLALRLPLQWRRVLRPVNSWAMEWMWFPDWGTYSVPPTTLYTCRLEIKSLIQGKPFCPVTGPSWALVQHGMLSGHIQTCGIIGADVGLLCSLQRWWHHRCDMGQACSGASKSEMFQHLRQCFSEPGCAVFKW